VAIPWTRDGQRSDNNGRASGQRFVLVDIEHALGMVVEVVLGDVVGAADVALDVELIVVFKGEGGVEG